VSDLPDLQVDLATMTGNVAQVFLADAEWDAVLGAARAAGLSSKPAIRRAEPGWSGTGRAPT
jgi:hypothetical protein